MTQTEILIIGGGISGLSVAWWLAQHGIRSEVWERDGRPGGKIKSTREAGYLTEQAAGLLVNHRPEIDRLISHTGLSASKCSRGQTASRYVVHKGQLTQVPMQVSRMAISPLWSNRCKLRLLAEILVPRGNGGHESVSQFVTRRLGKEILETAMDPFVGGTLASDPEQADARAVLPRLTALESRYGSLSMGMLLNRIFQRRRANFSESFSFQGGMSQLVDTLASSPGIQWRPDHEVQEIEPGKHGWQVNARTPDGSRLLRVHHLVLSTPADTAAKLVSSLDAPLANLLKDIEYAPLAVLHLGLDRKTIPHALNGTGFLVPRRERLSFNGNLWMSSLFPRRAPSGKVLFSSYIGGSRHPERFAWDNDRITDSVLADLRRLMGLRGDPDYVRIDRHAQALPLYHGRYTERLAAIKERLTHWPGLHLAANYIDGVSVRERIFQGREIAHQIAATCQRQRNRPPLASDPFCPAEAQKPA